MKHTWQMNRSYNKPACVNCREPLSKHNRHGKCVGKPSPKGEDDVEAIKEGEPASKAETKRARARREDEARKATGHEVADFLDWLLQWAAYGIEAKKQIIGTTGAEDRRLSSRMKQARAKLRRMIDAPDATEAGTVQDEDGVDEQRGARPDKGMRKSGAGARGLPQSIAAAAEQRNAETHPEGEGAAPPVICADCLELECVCIGKGGQ